MCLLGLLPSLVGFYISYSIIKLNFSVQLSVKGVLFMKNVFFILLAFVALSSAGAAAVYLTGILALGLVFFCGFLFGVFLMNLKLNVKNDRINTYKRELEKEAITSSENSSKVKVLESKIEVLEKALENALKK